MTPVECAPGVIRKACRVPRRGSACSTATSIVTLVSRRKGFGTLFCGGRGPMLGGLSEFPNVTFKLRSPHRGHSPKVPQLDNHTSRIGSFLGRTIEQGRQHSSSVPRYSFISVPCCTSRLLLRYKFSCAGSCNVLPPSLAPSRNISWSRILPRPWDKSHYQRCHGHHNHTAPKASGSFIQKICIKPPRAPARPELSPRLVCREELARV